MKNIIKLNESQRKFAEENHGLVFVFLKKYKLSYEDYYDVVVFGYLKAVLNYISNIGKFSTFAFKSMLFELQTYERDKKSQKRKVNDITDSIFETVKNTVDNENFTLIDLTPNGYNTENEAELNYILSNLTKNEKEIMSLLLQGYTQNEIALTRNITRQAVSYSCMNIKKKLYSII